MWSKNPRARERLAFVVPSEPLDRSAGSGLGEPSRFDPTAFKPASFDAPVAERGGRPLLEAKPSAIDGDSPDRHGRWFTRWDPRARTAALALLAGLAMVVAWWWWSGQPEPVQPVSEATLIGDEQVDPGLALDEVSGVVVVHVVGKVTNPGVVELPVGARVQDAIDAAGGATRDKALESVNLARPVVDGEQIVVGAAPDGASSSVISINSAGAEELDELPGVGPVIAERIVQWREENGPFSSIDELSEVSGIGPSIIEQIRDQVGM